MRSRMHYMLGTLFSVAAVCVVAGCTSQPPIVADPPQHAHTPPEMVPWEEQYARTRPKPEVFEDSLDGHAEQEFNGNLERQPEGEGFFDVVVDVLAFPFRGVGWVLQQVF